MVSTGTNSDAGQERPQLGGGDRSEYGAQSVDAADALHAGGLQHHRQDGHLEVDRRRRQLDLSLEHRLASTARPISRRRCGPTCMACRSIRQRPAPARRQSRQHPGRCLRPSHLRVDQRRRTRGSIAESRRHHPLRGLVRHEHDLDCHGRRVGPGSQGTYVTNNSGATWTHVGQMGKAHGNVQVTYLAPNGTLYLAAMEGIFRRPALPVVDQGRQ